MMLRSFGVRVEVCTEEVHGGACGEELGHQLVHGVRHGGWSEEGVNFTLGSTKSGVNSGGER
jgi:hypothetical protein